MAFVTADRVRELSTTSGTGPMFLGGPVEGYQSFADGVGVGNSTFYAISVPNGAAWEVGVGTVAVGSLSRDTVLSSSNGGAKVNFPAGTKDVFATFAGAGAVVGVGNTIQAPAGTRLPVANGGTGVATVEAEVSRLAEANNVSELGEAIDAVTKAGDNTLTGNNTFTGNTGFSGTVNVGGVTTLGSDAQVAGDVDVAGGLQVDGNVVMNATTAVRVPSGTTAQRPADAPALLRFNIDTGEFEGNNGSAWASVGGSAIHNDTDTDEPRFPLFADATSGTAANVYTADSDYTYNPGTGTLEAPVLAASGGLILNPMVITRAPNFPAGYNAISAGPVQIADGVTVTVPAGSTWSIV